ncbi:MAG: hypothetical protein E7404_07790 [Ruminococcaceae bacterium]|nr:hypothetical protein [Oscillospiraceae bacterium]
MKKLCLMLASILVISSMQFSFVFAQEVILDETNIDATINSAIAVEENDSEENNSENEINIEVENIEEVEDEVVESSAVTPTTYSYDGTTSPSTTTNFAKYNTSTSSGLTQDDNTSGPQNTATDKVYHVYGTSSVGDNGYWKFAFNKSLAKDTNFIKNNNYSFMTDLYFPTTTDATTKSEFIVSIGSGVDKSIGSSKTMNIVFRAGEYKESDSNFGNSGFVFYGLEKDRWHNVAIDFAFDGKNLTYKVYVDGILKGEHYRYSSTNGMYKVESDTIVPTAYASAVSSWYFLSRATLKFVNGEKHNFYFDNVIYKNSAYTPALVPKIESAVDGVLSIDEGKTVSDVASLATNAEKTEVYRYNTTTKTYTQVNDLVATGDVIKLVSLGGAYSYYQISVNAASPILPSDPVVNVEGTVSITDSDFEIKTLDDDIRIDVPEYKIGTNILSGNINKNDVITMTISGTNSGSKKSISAVSALYDENNTMLFAGYDVKEAEGDFNLSVELTSPLALEKGKYSIKTFIWDNADANYIYSDNFDTSKAGGMNFTSYGWNLTDYSNITSSDKYTGRTSLKIVSGTGSNDMISNEVAIEKNNIYKLVFAAKGEGGFEFDVMDTDLTSSLSGGAKTFDGNTEWDLSSLVFETKENEKVNLVFKTGNVASEAFIDSVAITNNLTSNGGFENGKTGYIFDENNDVIDTDVLSGTNAGYIKVGKIAQEMDLIAGYDYKLVFYSKGGKVTATILDETKAEIAEEEFAESTSYRYNVIKFKAPQGKDKFTVEFSATSDSYIDCVSLEKESANIIENAEFKYGIIDLWTVSNPGSSKLTAEKIDDGEYALKLANRPFNYTRVDHFISDGVNKNGTGKYKFSADVKFSDKDATGTFQVYLMYKDASDANQNDYQKFDNITDEWTTIEKEFEITDDKLFTDSRGHVSIATGDTSDFMIKNVKFVKVN